MFVGIVIFDRFLLTRCTAHMRPMFFPFVKFFLNWKICFKYQMWNTIWNVFNSEHVSIIQENVCTYKKGFCSNQPNTRQVLSCPDDSKMDTWVPDTSSVQLFDGYAIMVCLHVWTNSKVFKFFLDYFKVYSQDFQKTHFFRCFLQILKFGRENFGQVVILS